MNRREILKNGVGLACLGLFGGYIFKSANAEFRVYLRPPGAIKESEFVNKCIKCGLCVDACPYGTLKLASLKDSPRVGTPYFMPREIPCYMCSDIPCLKACPTGALDEGLLLNDSKLDINSSKMGIAIVDTKNCVAFWGIQCDACYRACPLIDRAIYLEYKRNERTSKHAFLLPVVDSDICTGCGKCQRVCITKKPAIKVLPKELVLGEVGEFYQKGWEEEIRGKKEKKEPTKKKSPFEYLNNQELL